MTSLPTTRWSLIAATASEGPEAREAWGALLCTYRPVVLAFFRRTCDPVDAEDFTQQFLARSIESGWWARADADAGSFRTFLYVLLRRFRRDMLARGPVLVPIPEGGWTHPDSLRAERDCDLAFVAALTQVALSVLSGAYAARGRQAVFEVLRADLAEPAEHGALARAADRLGMPRNTLVVERARFLARLRDHMRRELAQLCRDDAHADREWQALQAVLRGDR